jgi:ribosomal protein S27AE
MRHWLKTCPRCRSGHLLEENNDTGRAVTCLTCEYVLTPDEARFLIEDIVLADEPALRLTRA